MKLSDLQVKDAVLLPLITLQRQSAVELFYTGYFSQQHIVAMGDVVRAWLDKHESSLPLRRRLFSVFIEMGQNIVRYSSDERYIGTDNEELRFGSLCLHTDHAAAKQPRRVAHDDPGRNQAGLETELTQ